MSRYIDTEWLENNAKEYSLGYYEADEWATPLSVLDSAPSIDIVRCGECIKHNTHRCHMAFDLIATEDDDFCSYGSHSEKPNNSKEGE